MTVNDNKVSLSVWLLNLIEGLKREKKIFPQAYTTVPQEQMMPSSLISSILETSSQSRTALSPESALAAWKPRSTWQTKLSHCVNILNWLNDEKFAAYSIMLSDSGQSSLMGTTRWDVCGHRQWYSSQSHWPCYHGHCGGKETWYLLLWSETCRYKLNSYGNNVKKNKFCFEGYVLIFDGCAAGPTVEQQTEMARHAGRTLASLHPDQVSPCSFIMVWLTKVRYKMQYNHLSPHWRTVQIAFFAFYLILFFVIHIIFQRAEIICCLSELLTEKKEEILSANRRDMELASASGTGPESRHWPL